MSWRRHAAAVRRARAALERHGDRLRRRRGVVAVGVGPRRRQGWPIPGEVCLQVFVRRKPRPLAAIPLRMRLPASVDGVPIDVVEAHFVGALGCAVAESDRRVRHSTLVGGIALANTTSDRFGTLGALLEDDVAVYALTAAHVVETSAADVAQPFYAPDWIGEVEAFRWSTASNLDAALVRVAVASGRAVAPGMLDGPTGSLGTGDVRTAAGPLVVHGACNGRVEADVSSSPWAGTIAYEDGHSVTLRDQVAITPRAGRLDHGDSGAAVLDRTESVLLGIVIGGNAPGTTAIVTPIDSILDAKAFRPAGTRLVPI